MATKQDQPGEGNYDASRRYRKSAEEFVESGQVDAAAERARPTSLDEAEDLERAEEAAREGVPLKPQSKG